MTYEEKYKQIVQAIEDLGEVTEKSANAFEEPEWPDKIDDRKLVIQFRNAVFDHAFELGSQSVCHRLLAIIERIERQT